MKKTTWWKLLKKEFEKNGDIIDDFKTTLTEEELHKEFDDMFGMYEGEPFTAWGKIYVYFPVGFDGSSGVGYAPINPCNRKSDYRNS